MPRIEVASVDSAGGNSSHSRDWLKHQIRRKGPKRSEHVGMQKGANFTIVCTMVLIGLNVEFYEIFAKQHVYYSFFSIQLPYNKISSESK